MTDGGGYLLDNQQPEAGARFTALETLSDKLKHDFRTLMTARGVDPMVSAWGRVPT